MNTRCLAAVLIFCYMSFAMIRAEIPSRDYMAMKRGPKFDVRRGIRSDSSNMIDTTHASRGFSLDTLAGIGLGKRSSKKEPRFNPEDVDMGLGYGSFDPWLYKSGHNDIYIVFDRHA